MSTMAVPEAQPLPSPSPSAKRPWSPWQKWGLILLAPYIVVFLVFVLYPVCYGLWLARHPVSYQNLVDDPKVREGLIGALKDYTDVYTRGCTPPSSTSWKDPDNNVAFHNKTTVMTHNATISIAAKWLDDANNEQLSADQRAQAKKNYLELIRTAGFPKKPDGSPMGYRTAVKVGLIFAETKNKARAKEFVRFLLQEENLTPYVEGALGRWFPVTKAAQQRPFWQEDRHRKSVFDQYAAGTVTFEFTKNYKFTVLNNENVWAKAMNRVVSEKVPVEKAVDELIARIKQVAG